MADIHWPELTPEKIAAIPLLAASAPRARPDERRNQGSPR